MISKFDIIMYLETLLKKNIKNITKEELLNVKSITLEFKESDYDEENFDLHDIIKIFPNLEKINLKNGKIDRTTLKILSMVKLKSLSLINCGIQSGLSFQNLLYLKELSIINSSVLNYDFLKTLSKDLKVLLIRNPLDETLINISDIKQYSELSNLYLEKCVVDNIDELISFSELSTLSLLWSDINSIDDSDVFCKIPSLNELYISDCYCTPSLIKKIPKYVNIYKNLNHLVLE